MPRAARWRLLLFSLLCCAARASAQRNQPHTPPSGSAERTAILDALRAPVQKELKRAALFKVDHLKVQNGWAFLRGVPRQPGGKPMSYRGTAYQRAREDGVFDDWICALLRRQPGGKWRVVTYVIGATDVVYEGWDRQYKAPPAIFR
jgi:hypothetical protein